MDQRRAASPPPTIMRARSPRPFSGSPAPMSAESAYAYSMPPVAQKYSMPPSPPPRRATSPPPLRVPPRPSKVVYAEDRGRTFRGQLVAASMATVAAALGAVCMIHTAQANVCSSAGQDADWADGTPRWMGWYSSSTPLAENPKNCIMTCQKSCLDLYVESAALKTSCQECFDECTHPWGENIDTCTDQPACTKEQNSMDNYCTPLAKCYADCAGGKDGCLTQCAHAGQTAFASGCVAHGFALVGFLACPLIATIRHMQWWPLAFLGLLFWGGSLFLGADIYNLVATGNGFTWYLQEPLLNQVLVPNWMPAAILFCGLLANFFMILSYWTPYETWSKKPMVKQEVPITLTSSSAKQQMSPRANGGVTASMGFQANGGATEIPAQAAPPPAARAAYVGQAASLAAAPPPPAVQIHPEKVAAAPPPPHTPQDHPAVQRALANHPGEQAVTIGLSFAVSKDPAAEGEVFVDHIVPGGPGDLIGAIKVGDVVCEVGNVPETGSPPNMLEVYQQPILEWASIVKKGKAGSEVRFIFARHSEAKRFMVDVVRVLA